MTEKKSRRTRRRTEVLTEKRAIAESVSNWLSDRLQAMQERVAADRKGRQERKAERAEHQPPREPVVLVEHHGPNRAQRRASVARHARPVPNRPYINAARDLKPGRRLRKELRVMEGGGSDEARLGVVTPESLAGGKGSPSGLPHKDICHYCGEPDGQHTAQCPVVSKESGGTSDA